MDMEVYTEARVYILVSAPDIEETIPMLGCPTHGAISTPFCPKCGQAQTQIQVTVRRPAHFTDLLGEEAEDDLSQPEGIDGLPPGTFVLLGNRSDIEDGIAGDCVEITFNKIAGCLAAFNEHYAQILEELRSKATSVEVKFGLVTYVM